MKIRIEKRDGKQSQLYLAFLIIPTPHRYPFTLEELIMTADTEELLDIRLYPFKMRYGSDLEIIGA